VVRIDPNREPERAQRVHRTHLARAALDDGTRLPTPRPRKPALTVWWCRPGITRCRRPYFTQHTQPGNRVRPRMHATCDQVDADDPRHIQWRSSSTYDFVDGLAAADLAWECCGAMPITSGTLPTSNAERSTPALQGCRKCSMGVAISKSPQSSTPPKLQSSGRRRPTPAPSSSRRFRRSRAW